MVAGLREEEKQRTLFLIILEVVFSNMLIADYKVYLIKYLFKRIRIKSIISIKNKNK